MSARDGRGPESNRPSTCARAISRRTRRTGEMTKRSQLEKGQRSQCDDAACARRFGQTSRFDAAIEIGRTKPNRERTVISLRTCDARHVLQPEAHLDAAMEIGRTKPIKKV